MSIFFLRDISIEEHTQRALSNAKRDFYITLLLRYTSPMIGYISAEYKRINHLILERHETFSRDVAYMLL